MTALRNSTGVLMLTLGLGVEIAGGLRAGQPVEPLRNPFAGEAWDLPPETARPMAQPLQTHCQLCHSSDYLATQPPLSRTQWTAIVEKMRGKFGAVIPTNQVPVLADTLVGTFADPRPAASSK